MTNPTLFVHGNGASADSWYSTIAHLMDKGVNRDCLYTIDFDGPGTEHHTMSNEIDKRVKEIRSRHKKPVNLVGHSLGATGIRYWLEDKDRYDWVDTVVYIAGALHGTSVCSLRGMLSDDMCRPCNLISRSAMTDEDNILAQLNDGDETPGDVDHYTIRSIWDRCFILNPLSPTLDGATNVSIPSSHTGVLEHEMTHEYLYNWLYQ